MRRRVMMVAVVATMALAGCATEDAQEVPSATETAPEGGEVVAGMCAEDEPDCEDMVEPGSEAASDGAAGACPVDDPDCGDNPGDGSSLADEAVLVTPTSDLVDVQPTPWEEVTFDEDQTTATVYWWGGNESCFGLDRVEVDLEAETVTITVFTGTVPGDIACTMELVAKGVEVDMGEPLGPRSVVDGAA